MAHLFVIGVCKPARRVSLFRIRTSLCVHFEMFKVSNILVKNALASAKSEYYNKKIKASKGNQMTVFSVVNKVKH